LRSHEEVRALRGGRRRALWVPAVLVAGMLLSGCTREIERGWLPSTVDTTNQTGRIMALWNGSWEAALAVGVLVWGLILWAAVAYRRRRDDTSFPAQVRYNIPLEILYTIVPLMMIAVLFFYTASYETAIADVSAKPDVTINVVAKQWSWDFNYVEANVYESGVQVELDKSTGEPLNQQPVLVLPINKRVEFVLNARDVIHSFWVPAFLQKLDMIPGKTNRFQIVPTQEGTFQGKCAELCGAYHSQMLFQVKVVSQAAYDAEIARLKSLGQTGQLSIDLNREPVLPADQKLVPSASGS